MVDYFCEIDMVYGMLELNISAAVKCQRESTATTPLPSIYRAIWETLDIVPGKSQMLQGISCPGNT
jgi:hypothetical protein